jgi:hypothetical protein
MSALVRVDITVEPDSLIPEFLIKRAGKALIDAATEGLRNRVLSSRHLEKPE